MGRRPNPLILQYFERGAKLADNSNRYPHRCRLCGENFPKGRIDSLTAHLTRKCVAITEEARINAVMTLHGLNSEAQRRASWKNAKTQPGASADADADPVQGNWTALETLAEVSRQIEGLNDHHPNGEPSNAGSNVAATGAAPASSQPLDHTQPRFDLQDPFNLEKSPIAFRSHQSGEKQGTDDLFFSLTSGEPWLKQAPAQQDPPVAEHKELITQEQLEALLQSATKSPSEAAANLSMAAAAAARLNPSLLDPQLRIDHGTADAMDTSLPEIHDSEPANTPSPQTPSSAAPAPLTEVTQSPWGEMSFDSSFAQDLTMHSMASPGGLTQTRFRLDGPNGVRARHARAKFDAVRRKEVQEVRKIGACIRCRILRKTCSQESPCETCRKVLAPRVWRTGCVRTKFSEQLDLYSAGVQIVLAQKRVNDFKAVLDLTNDGVVIEATHFPDKELSAPFEVCQAIGYKTSDGQASPARTDQWHVGDIVMLDNTKEDIPDKVDIYMRTTLSDFIDLEPSHFVRATLQTAVRLASSTENKLLTSAIELWGLVEILDRERQWHLTVKPKDGSKSIDGFAAGKTMPAADGSTAADDAPSLAGADNSKIPGAEPRVITQENEPELCTTICLQLTAGAERKAAILSKNLLTGMQRILQDSKTRVDHTMFFTTLLLLICIEKSTWAFKAWEQDSLRVAWPLVKQPSDFTKQGDDLAPLLRMLLHIRKALPRIVSSEDGTLRTEDDDECLRDYLEQVQLKFADVQQRRSLPDFSPTDSRSYELHFCSVLLLPGDD